MYTDLVLGMKIEDNDKIIQTLRYMLGETEYQPVDDHELFRTDRWDYMLKCDSYYFDGQTDSKLYMDDLYEDNPKFYLNVRCNLKNYDNEINKFLDWLNPYIKTFGFLGYLRYEENEDPTLIYKTEKGIEYKGVTND